MQFNKPRNEESHEYLHPSISYNCVQYMNAHGFLFFSDYEFCHWFYQLQHSLSPLSHSFFTYTLIDEQNQLLSASETRCTPLWKACLCWDKEEREIQRENEGWQRRGVTETITVIPCVTARRYALHHSSFICFLIPLFCVSLSVCSVTSQCYLLYLSL